MANEAAKLLWNTRERMTSTDLNRARDITYRMIQQALASVTIPDTDKSGVISGLLVRVNATNRTVTVLQGIAILVEASSVGGGFYPDSKYLWIEVQDPITIPIDAGTGYERWDVVEIAPGTLVTSSSIRDIWDPTIPPSGSFVPQTVVKEEISSPVVTLRQGADPGGPPPFFPTGIADVIPLAYLRVASDGTVSENTAGIVRCRPLIRPAGALDQLNALKLPRSHNSSTWVQGGGVKIGGDDSANVELEPCTGQFATHNFGFSVADGASVDMQVDNAWDDGATGKPGGDAIAHAYAVAPPYIETGYVALAGREFVPGFDVLGEFATYGHISGFNENCIIVLSTSNPQFFADGGPTGTANIRDVPFTQGVATPAPSEREQWVYLGAFDQDGTVAKRQQYFNGGIVVPQQRVPFSDYKVAGLGPHNLRTPTSPGAGPEENGILPLTATNVAFTLFCRSLFIVPDIHVELRDETYSGWTTPAEARPQNFTMVRGDANGGAMVFTPRVDLILPFNGQVEIDLDVTLVNLTALSLRPLYYTDSILAQR